MQSNYSIHLQSNYSINTVNRDTYDISSHTYTYRCYTYSRITLARDDDGEFISHTTARMYMHPSEVNRTYVEQRFGKQYSLEKYSR